LKMLSSRERIVFPITLVAFLAFAWILVNAFVLGIFFLGPDRCRSLPWFSGVLFVVAGLGKIRVGTLQQGVLIAMAQLSRHVLVILLSGCVLFHRTFIAKLVF
jgi:hypothetical protein